MSGGQSKTMMNAKFRPTGQVIDSVDRANPDSQPGSATACERMDNVGQSSTLSAASPLNDDGDAGFGINSGTDFVDASKNDKDNSNIVTGETKVDDDEDRDGNNSEQSKVDEEKKPKITAEEVAANIKKKIMTIGDLHDDINTPTYLEAIKDISKLYFKYKTKSYRQAMETVIMEMNFADVILHTVQAVNKLGIFSSDKVWFPGYYAYNCAWNYSDLSILFAAQLGEKPEFIDILCTNLTHASYKENMGSKNIYYVLKSSMSILHNIARVPDSRTQLDNAYLINSVKDYLNCEHEFLSVLSALIVAYMTTDKDIAENEALLVKNDDAIVKIVKWMGIALRARQHRMRGFKATELAHGLKKLAMVDANKTKIVEAGALPMLHTMMQRTESKASMLSAVRLVWTLAFDNDAKQKILEDEGLMATLLELSKTAVDHEIKEAATGALWVIHKGTRESKKKEGVTPSSNITVDDVETDGRHKDKHIFISYNWENQETVLRIRDKLREVNLPVWIDVDHMSDNLLESMALAVENASLVLVCISERYKESPNCRTEGEYAFNLRKPMIPLLMQRRYRADGWLGALVGMKLYHNFSGVGQFDVIIDKLLKEIKLKLSGEESLIQAEVGDKTHGAFVKSSTASEVDVSQWSEDDVALWLKKNKLKSCVDSFEKINGRKLISLQKIRREAPSYFYECLEKKLEVDFDDVLVLIALLDELGL